MRCFSSGWILWIGLLLGGLCTNPVTAQVSPKALDAERIRESVNAVLGDDLSVTWTRIPLSNADKQALRPKLKRTASLPDSLYVGRVSTGEGTRFLIPDVAPSKSKTFSLLLFLEETGTVTDVDVLKYRENYGYEVDYSMFRRQFQGKSQPEDVQFRRTIQNISGATISARSMTHAVHDLLVFVNHVGLDALRPSEQ